VIVSPITRRSVVELFTILEGLETAVCRHAVERATKDDLIALSEMLGQLDEIRVTREPDRWAELNAEFHLGLAALAGLPRIDAELAQALDHWDRIRRAFFSDVLSHRAAEAQAEHRKILDALKSRKPERVEELLRDHNRVALKHYLKLLPDDTKPRS
jgi:DNA-binding GntR family transcriptional regulator